MSQISVRRAQTREKLADAAMEVFAERGIMAASVEEICERAGFTRGAFYSNYASKDDLLIELVQRVKDAYIATAQQSFATIIADAELDFEVLSNQVADLMLQMQPPSRTAALMHAEIELYAARSPSFAEQHRVLIDGVLTAIAELMQAAVASVDLHWVIPETEAAELLQGLHQQISVELLMTGSYDRDKLVRMLRPLLQSLLVPTV